LLTQKNLISSLSLLFLQQIFRPSLDAFDVLIHLFPKLNSRRFEAVDVKSDKSNRQLQSYFKEPGEKIPVTGFNPVNCFLAELRVSTRKTLRVLLSTIIFGYRNFITL
jgi:U3 small nucleolar RNA-associated protein 22